MHCFALGRQEIAFSEIRAQKQVGGSDFSRQLNFPLIGKLVGICEVSQQQNHGNR